MLPNKRYTPDEIARLAWNRRALILVPFALGLSLVPTLAGLLPEEYRSETLIMVIPQRIPDSYVRATVTDRIEERLPTISAQILSRSRLERIVQEFGLYPELAGRPTEDVVQRMRNDITGPKIEGTSRDAFRLSYRSRDPEVAHRVTSRLASLYLEQNLKDRTHRADNTRLFLEKELEDAKRQLIAQEKKLEAFRLRYAGQLPSQLAGNQQVIQTMQLQLQGLGESINRAKERRLLIEGQLAEAQSSPASTQSGGGPGSAPRTAAEELDAATAALERARRRYRPEHPSIGELEARVGELEARAEGERRAALDNSGSETRPLSSAEAERQRRIRGFEAELEVIDHQLSQHYASEQRLTETLSEYRTNVDAVPTRESELIELNRGYDVLRAAHDNLLLKLGESKIAANLERGEIGEQFSVIDHASRPARADNQLRRMQVMAVGPLGGLVLGLLLAALLEFRDSALRSEEDVFRTLTLPVLAMIPSVGNESERRARRARRVAVDLATVTALAGSSAVLVLWRLGL